MTTQNQKTNNIEIAESSRVIPQRLLDIAEKNNFPCDEVLYRIKGTLYLDSLPNGAVVPNMNIVHAPDKHHDFDAKERTVFANGCQQAKPLKAFKKEWGKQDKTPNEYIREWGKALIDYMSNHPDIDVIGLGRPKANVKNFTGGKARDKKTGEEFDHYNWKNPQIENSIFFCWQYKNNKDLIYSSVVWGDECFEFAYKLPEVDTTTKTGQQRIGQQFVYGSVPYSEANTEAYKPKKTQTLVNSNKAHQKPVQKQTEVFTEDCISKEHLEQFKALGVSIPQSQRAYELAIDMYL